MDFWKKNVENVNVEADSEQLSETVSLVFSVLKVEGPEGISFKGLNEHKVNAMHLSTALRCTYSFRDEIENWYEAFEIACHACKNTGIDPQDALYGMIDD